MDGLRVTWTTSKPSYRVQAARRHRTPSAAMSSMCERDLAAAKPDAWSLSVNDDPPAPASQALVVRLKISPLHTRTLRASKSSTLLCKEGQETPEEKVDAG